MRPRTDFQALLERTVGHRRVYFQAPEATTLQTPYIVYDREYVSSDPADDIKYNGRIRYNVQLVTTKADDPAWDLLLNLPYSSHDRHFVADKLHHDTFIIYF